MLVHAVLVLQLLYFFVSLSLLIFFLQKKLTTCLEDIREGIPPMHVVGQFLGDLFDDHQFDLPRRSSLSHAIRTHSLTSYSHDFTQFLHYCPCYTQSQLIQTVIGICSGVPEAFEVFRCRSSTTEGELSLFLKRAARHSLSIVLEVNRLPFNLQEVNDYRTRATCSETFHES